MDVIKWIADGMPVFLMGKRRDVSRVLLVVAAILCITTGAPFD